MLGIQAFSNLTTPPDVFGPTGHLVALLGLVGLYPVLADRTPTVARVAGAAAAVALVSWAVMTVTRLLAVAGIVAAVSDVLPGVFFMLVFASTILSYVLFGAAILCIEDSSRVVGLLVLAPGALILVALVGSTIAAVTALEGLVIGGGLALSMLPLGYILRTWGRSADSAAPAGKTTAG
jgi:hypothetical protein